MSLSRKIVAGAVALAVAGGIGTVVAVQSGTSAPTAATIVLPPNVSCPANAPDPMVMNGQIMCMGVDTATTVAPTTTGAPTSTAAPTTTAPATTTTRPATTTTAPASSTSTTAPATTTTSPATTTSVPSAGILWSSDFNVQTEMNRLLFQISNPGTDPNPPGARMSMGDHDMNCGGPDTKRPIIENHLVSMHVWWCAPGGAGTGHFMTGMDSEGYVTISFTPKAADGSAMIFPANANKVCWDQNITNEGGRKWMQLSVISQERYLTNGKTISYVSSDFTAQGQAIGSPIGSGDDFMFLSVTNSVQFFVGATKTFEDFGTDQAFNITDIATRQTMCVKDNGNGSITRTQTRPADAAHNNKPWTSTVTGPGRFPAGPKIIVIQDDTYNNNKDQQLPLASITWHIDNIAISSS